MSICGVILADGSDSRLWPFSRAMRPKQFLALHEKETMLQVTARRLSKLNVESSVIICNEEHRFFVAEQLREVGELATILLESCGKNTAPAIALAALSVKDDPLLLVLPAGHVVLDHTAFASAISAAVPLAESGKLVTFGIVPTKADSSYGYIRCGSADGAAFKVKEFVEKPSIEMAEEYVECGDYYWNSGMFLFKASRYLKELEEFAPDIYEVCKASVRNIEADLDFFRVDKEQFSSCRSDSVDYAVMEKTTDGLVVPMDACWSDIGSWSSLWDVSGKDANGNVTNGDVLLHNVKNSYIKTEGRLVTAVGVDDLVIISTDDAIMVTSKSRGQNAGIIVQQLKDKNRAEWEFHREVYRPWGKYNSVDSGPRHQVKRITVKPGSKLSVQLHYHRSEHWIVVSGIAKVRNGDNTFELKENESTYIPVGVVHSLENCGPVDLELIEIQSGSYLGEDDIVRFEDKYGRV